MSNHDMSQEDLERVLLAQFKAVQENNAGRDETWTVQRTEWGTVEQAVQIYIKKVEETMGECDDNCRNTFEKFYERAMSNEVKVQVADAELKLLKDEIEALKRENAELREERTRVVEGQSAAPSAAQVVLASMSTQTDLDSAPPATSSLNVTVATGASLATPPAAVAVTLKRGRGRPRKADQAVSSVAAAPTGASLPGTPVATSSAAVGISHKRGRGRPRKTDQAANGPPAVHGTPVGSALAAAPAFPRVKGPGRPRTESSDSSSCSDREDSDDEEYGKRPGASYVGATRVGTAVLHKRGPGRPRKSVHAASSVAAASPVAAAATGPSATTGMSVGTPLAAAPAFPRNTGPGRPRESSESEDSSCSSDSDSEVAVKRPRI